MTIANNIFYQCLIFYKCGSPVCGLHYGLHSIFQHTNDLYYCNLLNDESIQKTNNKKYMYRCIGGMICISKLCNLNLMFRHFALLMTVTEFLNLLFGTACLSIVYAKFCTNVFEKSDFLLNQFVLKMLCHTCDIKMYYIVPTMQ